MSTRCPRTWKAAYFARSEDCNEPSQRGRWPVGCRRRTGFDGDVVSRNPLMSPRLVNVTRRGGHSNRRRSSPAAWNRFSVSSSSHGFPATVSNMWPARVKSRVGVFVGGAGSAGGLRLRQPLQEKPSALEGRAPKVHQLGPDAAGIQILGARPCWNTTSPAAPSATLASSTRPVQEHLFQGRLPSDGAALHQDGREVGGHGFGQGPMVPFVVGE